MSNNLLRIQGLNVSITNRSGQTVQILRDVSVSAQDGGILGIVGESGSGKTMLLRSIMRILPENATQGWGAIDFDGRDVREDFARSRLPISMVFQDPLTSFNPLRRIGGHLTEVIKRFQGVRGKAAHELAVQALTQVEIPEPARVLGQFPHELSGGMRQRAMIAMALLVQPKLLLADEPTTALDATIQAQILALLAKLRQEEGLTVMLVTHDLGVVAALCDRMLVMKDGVVVEEGDVEAVFASPQHPYTRQLLDATPNVMGGAHE